MRTSIVSATLAVSGLLASITQAGPLTPPPGAVTSTMKTLSDVEPRLVLNATNTPPGATSIFAITAPGSYMLAGDLPGDPSKTSILIDADNVTLDLGGFTLNGGGIGILIKQGHRNIVMRNGRVTGMTSGGIVPSGATATDVTIEDLSIADCGSDAIKVGARCSVRRCTVARCGYGFSLGAAADVEDCTASDCTHEGFSFGTDSILVRCQALDNDGRGFSGGGGVLESCTAARNGGIGYQLSDASVLACTATTNTGNGFSLGHHAIADNCATIANLGLGLTSGDGAIVHECRATGNVHQGFNIGGVGPLMTHCVAEGNGSGSQAGIWITARSGWFDSNRSFGNGWGFYIDPDAYRVLVTRNTARSNTIANFSTIPDQNLVCPVITSPSLDGFASMLPWSNVAH